MYFLRFLLAGGMLLSATSSYGQDVLRVPERELGSRTITYAGSRNIDRYIPPPENMKEAIQKKGAGFIATYVDMPDEAMEAFDFAMDIWSVTLDLEVPIHIQASWESMDVGTLGSSSTTTWYRGGFIGALETNAYYTVSMAENIKGENLNDTSSYDIVMRFNQNADWYYGTDGNTPTGKYDLATVVLHEIGHGLGFSPSLGVNGDLGYWGLANNLPEIWDVFIVNNFSQQIIDTDIFPNQSTELYDQLTGGKLYFDGPVARSAYNNLKAKIYAPSEWAQGSSISHLDHTVFNNTDNALMTPFVNKSEAIHDPGLLTMAILYDMGWLHTRIDFNPVHDTEEDLEQVRLDITIDSDTSFAENGLQVIYSYDGFTTSATAGIVPDSGENEYLADIPIPEYNTTVMYYISVTDTFNREYTLPEDPSVSVYQFHVGTDTQAPVVVHTPELFVLEGQQQLKVFSQAVDNIGVLSSTIDYRVNNAQRSGITMDLVEKDSYNGYIPLSGENLQYGDSISYRIKVTDVASEGNTTTYPESGYFTLYVEELFEAEEEFSTEFLMSENSFITSGFEIAQPDHFSNPALHSKHPYESSEEDGVNLGYQAILRTPVSITDKETTLEYKEIVLIEPGSEGSEYGDSDFFDYVIVEYSEDQGENWYPAIEGYDSRTNFSWQLLYENENDGMNSTYIAGSYDFFNREIVLTDVEGVDNGDEILLRWRLFSDPYAHGWGWAIDNLSISAEQTTGILSPGSPAALRVFPNPAADRVNIVLESFHPEDEIRYEIYSVAGRKVASGMLPANSAPKAVVDVSGLTEGLYFIRIHSAKKTAVGKIKVLR